MDPNDISFPPFGKEPQFLSQSHSQEYSANSTNYSYNPSSGEVGGFDEGGIDSSTMIQLEDAAEMAEAITKRSSLEFNALTQTGIDSMASWDREQQATINAAVEEPEGAEEHHTPPPIMCPVSLSLIPRGSEVIIVGNHATEKDIYIGKTG